MLVSNTSSAASEKPTVCLFSGFNPDPPAEFTWGAQAVSSSCRPQQQQQQPQRNSQIHCNVLKKLPPHIWISPMKEEITSLQDAEEKKDVKKWQPAIKFNKHHLIHLNVLLSHPCWLYFCLWPMFCWHSLSLFGRIFRTIPISTWWFDSFWPAVRVRMIPNPFEPRRLMWLSKQENPDQQSQCLSWRLRPQTATCLLDSRWHLWSNNPPQCFLLGLSTNKCWQCSAKPQIYISLQFLRYDGNDYALIRFRRKNYLVSVWKGDVLA